VNIKLNVFVETSVKKSDVSGLEMIIKYADHFYIGLVGYYPLADNDNDKKIFVTDIELCYKTKNDQEMM